MPNRMVRDDLLTSERYWSCSPEARNLYVSIILSADDCARFTGSNFALRTKCMAGTVTAERIDKLLSELMDADLVRVYEHENARYLFVPRFRQTLRYMNSRYPAPPDGMVDTDPDSIPDVTPQQWLAVRSEVLERDGHACIRCQSTTKLAAHHINPRSRGGKSTYENLTTLCAKCNSWARTNAERCLEISKLVEKKQSPGNAKAQPKLSEVKRSEEKRSKPTAASEKISLTAEGVWQSISAEQKALWQRAYPALSLDVELSKAAAWILANPRNVKSNYARFITNWLVRSQERAPRIETESRMGKFVI